MSTSSTWSDSRRGQPGPARVTICIPTYNRSERLAAAIDSALTQTYEQLGVVVLDNASVDDTAHVVARFDDPRLRYTRRPQNVGPVANANQALADATGEYVLLLHDDDVLSPEFVGAAVCALDAEPSAALAFGPWWDARPGRTVLCNPTGWRDRRLVRGDELVARSMAELGVVAHVSTTLFRRAALPTPAFEPQDGFADDVGLVVRVALQHDAVYLPVPAGTVAFTADSLSAASGRGLVGERELRDMKLRLLQDENVSAADAARWRAQVEHMYRRRVMWRAGVELRTSRSLLPAARVVADGSSDDRRLLTDVRAWRDALVGALSPRLARAVSDWRRKTTAVPQGTGPTSEILATG